ncbi:Acyl transferase/acyl hydrolase/lysophospholipase [Penicillium expansum]|nr:Acyl transferase/acyl hydrolase/lysophospholipase [Penicillium expansum]
MARQLEYANEPIAVVGSACRFPGDASSPSKLWELLRQPHDVISDIPPSRFNTDGFYHEDALHHGATNVRQSYILKEDHRHFDAQFFGVKPVEANSIDPQQRLLMETAYEALEAAGIPMEKIQGSNTGVYVGLMTGDYADLLGRDIDNFPTYFASGTARSIISNRISYFFDLHGPSMTIDTACSSSLYAIHQAVQSLRSGESGSAIVAGSNLLLGPEQYVAESKLKMLSPNSRSRMWDKDADGYARGDGVGVLVLKTLSQALADHDNIECIVRETGVNQDGRTKGITMPNPVAQQELINATYQKAGLDLSKPADRPQYFEAHGTGTPAGDPMEAEAISTAFFGPNIGFKRAATDAPLYVGSIKTVVGHTEGTAGIAGVMKASLALQNSTIPPNLLFNELSPRVKPFYTDLRIAQEAQQWPEVQTGDLRRASVNSFGFGGANAHAILENFVPDPAQALLKNVEESTGPFMAPFNFSAGTEKSLANLLSTYSSFIKENPTISLRDISWTLNTRRSTLPFRVSISALTVEDLAKKLEDVSQNTMDFMTVSSSQATSEGKPRLLGVFTGQGAQWATMGADLLRSSPLFSECIDQLQSALNTLPAEHVPEWTIREELLKDKDSSRIGQAALSQPLCTAVQVALVTLLRAAKIDLAAVVGHSSGEIAAAHAAGYLSAEDSIRIAYYRGFFLKLAGSEDGAQGGMMAIGTSHEDAEELCELPSLEGRICIAARNSPNSLTLSGDLDAIEEVKDILEDEQKFARLLKVEKAYHSHHMKPCFEPYVAALKTCDIKILTRSDDANLPVWISSVVGENIESIDLSELQGKYWGDNMCQAVLFSQAVEYAIGAEGPFDMGIEVGPHPALKGPATSTIKEISGQDIPYIGTLARGVNAIEAIADSFGSLWKSLGPAVVNFTAYDEAVYGSKVGPQLLKGLPTYPWDHDRIYWHESRYSKAFRGRSQAPHELLGTMCPDGINNEVRFKNYLTPREIPWLVHHQIQGQIVFPAAGYISAVVEAAVKLYPAESIQMLDFIDFIIGQAITLEENGGVDTILSLKVVEESPGVDQLVFAYYSDSGKDSGAMVKNASGKLRVVRGAASKETLPSPYVREGMYLDLEWERFYMATSELGFGYTGPFQALSNTSRRLGEALGTLGVPEAEGKNAPSLIIHPGTLDCAIQSIMLAFSYPGDGRLRTIYLPTKVDRLRINLAYCRESTLQYGAQLPFYSSMADNGGADLSGDVEVYSVDSSHTIIQLQGLHATPLDKSNSENDANIFSELTWGPEIPTGTNVTWEGDEYADDLDLSFLMEKVAYFYLRQIDAEFPKGKREGFEWHHDRLFDYVDHCLEYVASGTHPYAKKEWINDKREEILKIIDSHPDSIDLRIMKAVGENMPTAIRGDMNILEAMMHGNMLNDFYAYALGMNTYLEDMARIVGQFSHRFPHMNILEIGSGTGGATDMVLKRLNGAFSSYTYTDISSGFFEKAEEKFAEHRSRMIFKVCDIENSPAEQGYVEGSYDLVIASLVLHATRNIEETMHNARKLLKPGGHLIMVELTDNDPMRFGFIFGGLPGWWLGHNDGRKLSPCVEANVWEDMMLKTGFSGITSHTPHNSNFPLPLAVIACQAVDDKVSFLREPLLAENEPLDVNSLTIIGGKGDISGDELDEIVSRHYKEIHRINSLNEAADAELPFSGTVVCLADLFDESTFEDISLTKLKALQNIFNQSKNILWVTCGAQADSPYKNMFIGLQRSVILELTHVRCQVLDFATPSEINFEIIAKKLLQLDAYSVWDDKSQLKEILWYNEPEILIENQQVMIPRFRLSPARNNRYNSSRRLLTRDVNIKDTTLSITPQDSKFVVREKQGANKSRIGGIKLSHSLLKAIRVTGKSKAFISLGEDSQNGSRVIVLSSSLDSHVYAPTGWTIAMPQSDEQALKALMSLYMQLLAHSILENAVQGKLIAVFNPGYALGGALANLAAQRGIQLVLLTTAAKNCTRPWAYVHPRATTSSLHKLLPRNLSMYVDMDTQSETSQLVQGCLPPDCPKLDHNGLVSDYARLDLSPLGVRQVSDHVQMAWLNCVDSLSTPDIGSIPTISLDEITENSSASFQEQAIVSWEGQPTVRIQMQPANKEVSFASDKTFWLVGLTGGLGLSLCQWMVERGARYIALSSRNPKIQDAWLQMMSAHGCTVRVFANDVTNRQSVRGVYKQINDTMPTIGGVAQGAMVLHDTLFPDLDMERLENVVKPKVLGSIYLNELFSEANLDFFIYFSSMAYVTGNPGQSAYSAANAFMASQAAQRRKRGLAGSVINIGAIMGNGYVSRELTLGQQSFLHKVGHSWMSEQDFQEIFAEGVLAGRPGFSDTYEMATGLRLDDDAERDWASNPMFQHLVRKASHLVTGQSKNKAGAAIKPQLLEATSEEEVFEILKGKFSSTEQYANLFTDFSIVGFLLKLQIALQADPDMPMLEVSPDELGVDSLVAVDIQSWFRKEVGVDMPVLKVLNALSVRDLLYAAQEMLSPEMVPNLGGEPKPKSVDPIKEAPPAPIPTATPQKRTPSLTDISSTTVPTIDHSFSSERQLTPTSDLEPQTPPTNASTPPPISPDMEEKLLGSYIEEGFERVVPMSFAQSRFWFLNFFVENKTAFNVTSVVHLRGKLDIEKFGKALTEVGQRHEAIRTVFYTDENTKQHMQGVLPKSTLTLQHANVNDEGYIQKAVREMQDHVFDLAKGDSLRLQLISLSEERHCIILAYHHIAVDGIGFPIFFADLEKAYNGTLDLSGAGMLQYPDFSLRQLHEYEQGSWSKELSYWRSQFPDLPAPLPLLPLSQRSWRPNSSSFGSHLVDFRMDQALKTQIEQCCRRFKVTPFHFYLAVFRILLFRFTNGIDDMCIGVADGNRKDADVLQSLGLFLNLLPLRFRQDPKQTFADALKDVKSTSDGAFANSRVPFDLLLNELQVPRSPSYSPLFQSFLNYRQNIVEARSFCGCSSDGELIAGGQNAYDISVDVVDVSSGDNLVVFAVNKDLYSKDDADVLKKSYLSLLQGFARNPAARIVWPALHLEEDVKSAVELGRGDEQTTQWPSTIVDRIDDMSKMYSERAALTDGVGKSLTYKQMASRVSELAALLLDRGVGSGSCVGVFQSSGPEWVCSVLAILRTGAAYVPLDSRVGLDRLLLVVEDCKPQVLFVDSITEGETKFLSDTGADIINISTVPVSEEDKFVPSQANPSDTAVIAYTSGTTGVPKGVVLKHSGYKNFLEFAVPRWGIKEGEEIVLQQSSYAFDMSMGQIIVGLGFGGTLVIPDTALRRDPAAVCDILVSQGVTFTLGTPTEYMAWIQHGGQELLQTSQWRGAMSGGEAMTESLVRAFRSLQKPDLKLINSYGPAETTCACADSEVSIADADDLSFAVVPSPNYSIYIVDENMNPVPAGVPGEVVIGGAGVAGGYLNQEKATSAAFLPGKQATPFFKEQGWNTVHASGDRGQFTADGRLVLQGRIEGSTQIKIGGIRMDLEDIENTIVNAAAPHINQAVVSVRQIQNSDNKYLVAFIELSDNQTDQSAFLAELPQKLPLPQYMRPSTIVALDAIPKTSSNKVDRSAINSMELPESTQPRTEDDTADLNEFEDTLRGLWEQVLPQEVLRSHILNKASDFFHVGGNSLSLVSLQTQIRERLDITVPLSQLFQAITLGEMAVMLQDQGSGKQTIYVDWEKEVEVPSDLIDAPKSPNPVEPSTTPSIVVLTGSTGFLGKEILRQLTNNKNITKIYCLAVRKPREQLSKIFDHHKVIVYGGDLGAKQLGLSKTEAKAVFDEADAVIHVGADVSFMKTYQSLKLINVASTKELVRLSVPRRVPFHFVSSASVARLSGLDAFGPVSVEEYPPNGENDDGYTSAKWVSEVYLERINKQLGLPVAIHRPSSITGDDTPESDLMSNMMKYSREIKAIPDSSAWSGHFDFISVQSVARTIISDAIAGAENMTDSPRYLYESGEIEIGMEEVQDLMEMGTGESFGVLSVDEWIDSAAKAGMNPLLAMYLRRAAGGQVLFPKLLQQ